MRRTLSPGEMMTLLEIEVEIIVDEIQVLFLKYFLVSQLPFPDFFYFLFFCVFFFVFVPRHQDKCLLFLYHECEY